MQHSICHMEGVSKSGPFIGKTEQILIWNHNQRINISLQGFNTCISLFHSALAFKIERLGDNTDGQDAALFGGAGNHGGCPCTGAATHTCGDEHHMAVGKFGQNLIQRFFCSLAAHFRF